MKQEINDHLAGLNRVCEAAVFSLESQMAQQRGKRNYLAWFEKNGVALEYYKGKYMLAWPHKRTFAQIHDHFPFNYGALARDANIEIDIVLKMLYNEAVEASDAKKVLDKLGEFIRHGGPYSLDNVEAVLM